MTYYPDHQHKQFSLDLVDRLANSIDRQQTGPPNIAVIISIAVVAVGSAGFVYLDAIRRVSDIDNDLEQVRTRLDNFLTRLENTPAVATVSLMVYNRLGSRNFSTKPLKFRAL